MNPLSKDMDAISGSIYFNDVFEYNPAVGLWADLTNQMSGSPAGRRAHGQVVIGSSLYVFGGWAGGK